MWQWERLAKMKPAFVWECPECGTENFNSGDLPTEEEQEQIATDNGDPPGASGSYIWMPDEVTCDNCTECFETIHWGDMEEDDEDDDEGEEWKRG